MRDLGEKNHELFVQGHFTWCQISWDGWVLNDSFKGLLPIHECNSSNSSKCTKHKIVKADIRSRSEKKKGSGCVQGHIKHQTVKLPAWALTSTVRRNAQGVMSGHVNSDVTQICRLASNVGDNNSRVGTSNTAAKWWSCGPSLGVYM